MFNKNLQYECYKFDIYENFDHILVFLRKKNTIYQQLLEKGQISKNKMKDKKQFDINKLGLENFLKIN